MKKTKPAADHTQEVNKFMEDDYKDRRMAYFLDEKDIQSKICT